MSVSSKHLFISIASLSWMEVNFLKPVSMYGITARRFPIYYFLSVALSESRYIFVLGPYSSLSNSFFMLLIHLAFLICSLRSHILLSLSSGCWFVFMYLSRPVHKRKQIGLLTPLKTLHPATTGYDET